MAVIDFDLSVPVATLLRTGTVAAHDAAQTSQGAGWLTRGELDKEEYVRFLMMLWHVYDTLERALERHAAHPTLSPTHNPTLLARAPSLASDIAHILQTPEPSWTAHPLHASLRKSPPRALTAYTARIAALADAADPSALLAHAYVRYLGDLSGGQIIRRRVAKAYGLDLADGLGTRFYDFRQLGGSKSGNVGDFKKIKEWYRDGMNQGVGDDQDKKVAILEEAEVAFKLNGALLDTLRAPSSAPSHGNTPSVPPLGNPNLSDQSPSPSPPPEISAAVIGQASEQPAESTVSLATIVSVVLAVSIAHFALVVGGFTGDKGYVKWEVVQDWISGVFAAGSG